MAKCEEKKYKIQATKSQSNTTIHENINTCTRVVTIMSKS